LTDSQAFAAALLSSGPNTEVPAKDQIFAPFIGSWDLIVRWHDAAGQVTRQEQGEWYFSWVLEGRGIQDVWIVPPRGARKSSATYEYGTSIRFYDLSTDGWQSIWIGPEHKVVRTFAARRIDDRVVLETPADVVPRMRWSFSEISADTFRWTNEIHDDGVWWVQQSFEARRRTSAALAGDAAGGRRA
jgi:hypothetical protein